MANISSKIRKELWGKAAGRCSICKKILTLNDDCHTNISNECHIVSEKKNGPRHVEGISDYDDYDNLILLCRNHHVEVDTNVKKYTIEELKRIKLLHEKYIYEQLEKDKKFLMVMTKIKNGSEFGNLLWGCHSFVISDDSSKEAMIRFKDELNENVLEILNIQYELTLPDKNNIYEELDLFLKKIDLAEFSIYASVSQTLIRGISTRCVNILLTPKTPNDLLVLVSKKH